MIIYNYTYKERPVPEVGKEYHFFDDGKISPGRHYIATITRILTKEEAKNIIFELTEYFHNGDEEDKYDYKESLYDIWQDDIKEHYWLIAEDTDYIVEASIPDYDENLIYFVRTKDGGWFSMDIQSSWQGGRLDVTGNLYESIKEYFN